jgi:hypothetical protein
MTRTIEQITASLVSSGIDPNGYGNRIGESLEDFTQRLIDSTTPIELNYDLERIIAEDIRDNWPHCAPEVGQ